jgi:phage tail-like protein
MTHSFLHQLQISDPSGEQTIELGVGTAVIGRQAGADIQLEHKLISRRHASFTCTDTDCTITDLKSSNGTKRNGQKLSPNQPQPLADGDIIEIGPYKITYVQTQMAGEPEPSLAPDPVPELISEEPVEQEDTPEPAPVLETKEPPPPPPPADDASQPSPPAYEPPPGLPINRSEYLKYLPDIYHTDFMTRFLAMFESIYIPARWNIDNFDIFLHPQTAPDGFFPWLASWFELAFDNSWSDEQRRTLLTEAHEIFARRGTKKALSRILEIYTGQTPTIDDTSEDLAPFTFTVYIPLKKSKASTELIEALINQHKPAYTNYELKLKK